MRKPVPFMITPMLISAMILGLYTFSVQVGSVLTFLGGVLTAAAIIWLYGRNFRWAAVALTAMMVGVLLLLSRDLPMALRLICSFTSAITPIVMAAAQYPAALSVVKMKESVGIAERLEQSTKTFITKQADVPAAYALLNTVLLTLHDIKRHKGILGERRERAIGNLETLVDFVRFVEHIPMKGIDFVGLNMILEAARFIIVDPDMAAKKVDNVERMIN